MMLRIIRIIRITRAHYMFLRKERFGLLGFDPALQEPFVIEEPIPEDIAEYCDIIESRDETEAFLSAPLSLYIYPSMACNKSCHFCYFREQINRDSIVMTEAIARTIINMCIEHGVFSVNILGGEPLLNKTSTISKLFVDKLCSRQIAVNITTNGISLGKHAHELKQYMDAYGEYFNINVSLNNGFDIEPAYKQVKSSLNVVEDIGLEIGINTVVLSKDIADYRSIVNYVNKRDTVKKWYLLYPRIGGDTKWQISQYIEMCSQLESLIENKKTNIEAPYAHKYNQAGIDTYPYTEFHYGCGMGKRTLSITPDGKVYGCSKLIRNKAYLVGHVTDDLTELWRSAYEIRKGNDLKLVPKSCHRKCSYHSICEGCLADKIENVEAVCEFR